MKPCGRLGCQHGDSVRTVQEVHQVLDSYNYCPSSSCGCKDLAEQPGLPARVRDGMCNCLYVLTLLPRLQELPLNLFFGGEVNP